MKCKTMIREIGWTWILPWRNWDSARLLEGNTNLGEETRFLYTFGVLCISAVGLQCRRHELVVVCASIDLQLVLRRVRRTEWDANRREESGRTWLDVRYNMFVSYCISSNQIRIPQLFGSLCFVFSWLVWSNIDILWRMSASKSARRHKDLQDLNLFQPLFSRSCGTDSRVFGGFLAGLAGAGCQRTSSFPPEQQGKVLMANLQLGWSVRQGHLYKRVHYCALYALS